MDFADDELEDLRCFHPHNCSGYKNGVPTSDDNLCNLYEVNKSVIEDAKQGCW